MDNYTILIFLVTLLAEFFLIYEYRKNPTEDNKVKLILASIIFVILLLSSVTGLLDYLGT